MKIREHYKHHGVVVEQDDGAIFSIRWGVGMYANDDDSKVEVAVIKEGVFITNDWFPKYSDYETTYPIACYVPLETVLQTILAYQKYLEAKSVIK